jgi:redox-sensitive bicupin YhaK (pirin superfamily)
MEKRIDYVRKASFEGSSTQVRQNRLVVPPRDFDRHSPFLLLAEDWFDASGGFDTHPHRGFETVTLVLDGALEHRDHTGSHGVLYAGDVQWMTAGRGVLHSETAHGDATVHSLQLWLNLPADRKMTAARYVDQRLPSVPVHRFAGGKVRVYAGSAGDVSHPHGSIWPLALLDVHLDAGATHKLTLPAPYRGFLYVIDGRARIGASATPVGPTDVAWFEPGDDSDDSGVDTLTVAADSEFRAIVYASRPIDEPVAAHGPFVMNQMHEVQQAYADYHAGRLSAAPSGAGVDGS